MRISVLQMNSVNDMAANLEQARKLAAEAVREDRPDLLVLPEVWAFMGGTTPDRQASAEALPGGEAYKVLQDMARSHGVFVHGGSFFEREKDQVYNTTVAFDRGGNEIARYRKIHLFDVTAPDGRAYRESAVVGRGDRLVVYEAEGVKVGCTICYDLRFGELYRGLAARGAQVIMVPAAFTLQTGKDHWEVLLRSRAIETETYVAASAQWGAYPSGNEIRSCWGHSMIVDPWGHVLAQAQDSVGFATARIDLAYLGQVRQNIPVHEHRVLAG